MSESSPNSYSLDISMNPKLHTFINELIEYITKKHDEGIIGLDQIKRVIIQQINQSAGEFIKLLSSSQNQTRSQYIWFLRLFYHYGIGIDEDGYKAFELISKAAKDNYPMAKVYVDKYYYNELKWHLKAAEQGNANA